MRRVFGKSVSFLGGRLSLVAMMMFVLTTIVSADTGTIIYACVNKSSGIIRIVSSTTTCERGEYPLSWNNSGPQGPQGPQGPAGEGLASIDELDGVACQVGTPLEGTVQVSYNQAGLISLICVPLVSPLKSLTVKVDPPLNSEGVVVTDDGAALFCPPNCTVQYYPGTTVTLTAAQMVEIDTVQYVFQGWSGACSGTGTCTLTINNDLSVTAFYAILDQ